MQFDRLSDGISLAFGRNQKALADATARLSSGLRINTAADDPSGLAIAAIVIGFISLVLGIIISISVFASLGAAMNTYN